MQGWIRGDRKDFDEGAGEMQKRLKAGATCRGYAISRSVDEFFEGWWIGERHPHDVRPGDRKREGLTKRFHCRQHGAGK
jgi:hypothetical protein